MGANRLEATLDRIMRAMKSPVGKAVAVLLAWSLAFMAWSTVAIDCAAAADGGSTEKAAATDTAKEAEKAAAREAAEKAAREAAEKEREAKEREAKEREAAEKAAKEREAQKEAQKESQKETAVSEKAESEPQPSESGASPDKADEAQGSQSASAASDEAATSSESSDKSPAAKPKEESKSKKSADKKDKANKRDEKSKGSADPDKADKADEDRDSKKGKKRITYPAATFGGSSNGVSVSVQAPEGALPKGAKMTVLGTSCGAASGIARAGDSARVVAAKAVSIAFDDKDGKDVTPRNVVRVCLSGVYAGEGQQLHAVDLAANAEVAEAPAGSGTVAFSSADPSAYALVVTEAMTPSEGQGEMVGQAVEGAGAVGSSGELVQGTDGVGPAVGASPIVAASGQITVADIADVVYSGNAQTPAVAVTDAETGTKLAAGKDYAVSYSNNINAGEGAAIVTGAGDYEGETVECAFTIKPAPLSVVTASATKPYDGKPLTAPGRLKGLVNKEEATLKTTGSQKRQGKSKNTYKIVWDKTAVKSNYTVAVERIGTLTVGVPVPDALSKSRVSPRLLPSPGIPSPVAVPSFRDLSSLGGDLPDLPDVTASDYTPAADEATAADNPVSGNRTSAFTSGPQKSGWPLLGTVAIPCAIALAALIIFFAMRRRRDRERS